MEIDALTKKGKGKSRGKSKTDGSKTSCFVCGRVGPHGQRLLVQGHKQGQRTQQQGQERQRQRQRQRQRKEQCERSPQLRHSRRRLHQEGTSPVKFRESPKMTLGIVLFPWMRMKTMNTKLDTSWQRSDTEKHSYSLKIGRLLRVLVDNCADEHVCSPRDFEWIAI